MNVILFRPSGMPFVPLCASELLDRIFMKFDETDPDKNEM
jgi:hypothetical protein